MGGLQRHFNEKLGWLLKQFNKTSDQFLSFISNWIITRFLKVLLCNGDIIFFAGNFYIFSQEYLFPYICASFYMYFFVVVPRVSCMIEIHEYIYIYILIPNNPKLFLLLMLYPFISAITYSAQSYIKWSLIVSFLLLYPFIATMTHRARSSIK